MQLATPDNKPDTGPNETAIVVDSRWQVVPDFRGKTAYDAAGNATVVSSFGPLPAGLALDRPAPTLEQARAAQVAIIEAAYADACAVPVEFTTAAGVAQTFQADPGSRAILSDTLAGLQGAGAAPPGFWWLAADNTQVSFTYPDLQGLAAALLAQGWVAFQRRRARKDAIAAAQTPADVQAVTW